MPRSAVDPTMYLPEAQSVWALSSTMELEAKPSIDPTSAQEKESDRLNAGQGERRRVAMIVGDNDTLHCGVKDGAKILSGALHSIGYNVDLLAPQAWKLPFVWKFLRELKGRKYDLVHVQYPSIGYRATLVPQILGLLRASRAAVVTLHEYSALPKRQQLTTHLFRWSADTILFGSEYERSQFNRRLGLLGARQEVFPILSQVPGLPCDDRDATVAYFGQIRPNKGLEAYLELASHSIRHGRPYEFHIMGSVSKAHVAYAESLRAQSSPEVRWSFDLPFEEVGQHLGRAFAAYLPFPDGASERRGSLLAAWLNGVPVLSRVGSATTPAIRSVMIAVADERKALEALDELAARPDRWENLSQASRRYAQKHSWGDVAERHARVYRALLQE